MQQPSKKRAQPIVPDTSDDADGSDACASVRAANGASEVHAAFDGVSRGDAMVFADAVPTDGHSKIGDPSNESESESVRIASACWCESTRICLARYDLLQYFFSSTVPGPFRT
jgi:hypothetical protein